MAFRNPAYRRVAGHLSNQIYVEGYESGPQPHPCSRHGGLVTGMSGPNHHHLKAFDE